MVPERGAGAASGLHAPAARRQQRALLTGDLRPVRTVGVRGARRCAEEDPGFARPGGCDSADSRSPAKRTAALPGSALRRPAAGRTVTDGARVQRAAAP